LTLFAAAALALRFVAESVSIAAAETDFTVEGQYTFERDAGDASLVVLEYPFLFGNAEVSSLRAFGADIIESDAARAALRLAFEPRQTRATVRVRYVQRLGARRAAYLVTSARAWGQPITDARFSVNAPRAWGKPRSSWPLPAEQCADARCTWAWSLRDFRPEVNLELHWKAENPK
jgi:hypothetical protein